MIRGSCKCTAPLMLREGIVVCAVCSAPVEALSVADLEVSTIRLPADCRNGEQFNRTLRSGRVDGARKVGRIWVCSRAAWDARNPALPPSIAKRDVKPANVSSVSDSLLESMGMSRSA